MTNEELALQVQAEAPGSAEQLWEQVKLLTFQFAGRFFSRSLTRCDRYGVTLGDLQQECFLAVMDAATAYNPESGFKFTAYLKFPLKNHFNALIGCRGNQKENPLNSAASLDEPLPGTDDSAFTLLNTLEDDSIDLQAAAEESEIQLIVRSAVQRLVPFHRFLIERYYFQGCTREQIAQEAGMEQHQVRTHHQKALNELRKDSDILKLKPFYVFRQKANFYSRDPLDVFLWGM